MAIKALESPVGLVTLAPGAQVDATIIDDRSGKKDPITVNTPMPLNGTEYSYALPLESRGFYAKLILGKLSLRFSGRSLTVFADTGVLRFNVAAITHPPFLAPPSRPSRQFRLPRAARTTAFACLSRRTSASREPQSVRQRSATPAPSARRRFWRFDAPRGLRS